MGEQRHHGRENAEGDVTRDLCATQSEERGGDEADETDADGGKERLSQLAIMPPSPFIVEWIARLGRSTRTPRHALDVAMGRGRHALCLARAGFVTFGVDIKLDAACEARRRAAENGVELWAWCADLTQHPLPDDRFDLVVVARYLQRDLFPGLKRTVKPAGAVVYETFTTRQRELGVGPRSPDHLLEPGELLRAFDGFDVLFYDEMSSPEAVARIVARRR
jgi:tellurite methyltransferase